MVIDFVVIPAASAIAISGRRRERADVIVGVNAGVDAKLQDPASRRRFRRRIEQTFDLDEVTEGCAADQPDRWALLG